MKRVLIAVAVCGLGCGLAAHADTITNYALTIDGCSGGNCGAGPFGNVKVDEATNNLSATITVTLNSNVNFSGTGAGDALAFSLSGSPTITYSGIPTGFEADTTLPVHASTFGDFTAGVTCDYGSKKSPPEGACHGGSGPSTLSFTITSTDGMTPLTFVESSGKGATPVYFSSDIAILLPGQQKVNTGNVGAPLGDPVPPPATTPEPSSLALLGSGVLGLAGVVRRKFRRS